jgi:iron complex outermembrane receptor protein
MKNMFTRMISVWMASTIVAGLPQIVAADSAYVATNAAAENEGLETIVVTAQRRSTDLERTPVAVTALNSRALTEQGVHTEADIRLAVPGVTVKASKGSDDLNFSIRGQTTDSDTSSQPAVQPYFDEVPVNGLAASSLYDLKSLQVLKGPQGTLFGRNVTGGAILYTSATPTEDFGGYATVRFGNYSRREIEGAINLPVSPKLLLRISTDILGEDGYTENVFYDKRIGDISRRSGRFTALFRPADGWDNTAVLDYSRDTGSAEPIVPYSVYSLGQKNNGIPLNNLGLFLFSPLLDATTGVAGSWNAYLAAHPGADPLGLANVVAQQQQVLGPYKVNANYLAKSDSESWLGSNITSYEVSSGLKLRNIFGYVEGRTFQLQDIDGTPYAFVNTLADLRDKQFTDELQAVGEAFDKKLTYVAGLYYFHGVYVYHSVAGIFDVSPIIPITIAIPDNAQTTVSYSGYAQGTYDLGSLTGVEGLGFTSGIRYTRESITEDQIPGGTYYNRPGFSNSLSDVTSKIGYQIGVQEQLNDHLLLYVTHRRSFRSAGFNATSGPVPGGTEQGGPLFKPEIARDVEAGAKYRGTIAGAPFRVNVAAYHEWVDDVQRGQYFNLPIQGLGLLTVSVPEAVIDGVEIDGQIAPTSWLNVGGNIAYADARFANGRNSVTAFGQTSLFGPYPDTPRFAGSVFAQVNVPLPNPDIGALSLRGDIYGQSSNYFSSLANTTSPMTQFPAYFVSNFRVGLDDVGVIGCLREKCLQSGVLAWRLRDRQRVYDKRRRSWGSSHLLR